MQPVIPDVQPERKAGQSHPRPTALAPRADTTGQVSPQPAAATPWRRWLPTVAALCLVAITARAGLWQLDRAQQKIALQAAFEARAAAPVLDLNQTPVGPADDQTLRYRRATVQGRYLPAGQIYIDNRDQDGVPGYHVLTPLALGQGVILVNRGFLARDASYPRPPAVPVPEGEVRVQGMLSQARSRFLELSGDTVQGAVWQNLRLDRYAAATRLDPLPLVLLADPATPGLSPVRETPDAGVAMHQGYAFQWFAMAAAVTGLYLYFTFFRRKPTQS